MAQITVSTALPAAAALIYQTTATPQAITNNTTTQVTLDTVSYDGRAMKSGSTLVIPVGAGGIYVVTGAVSYASNSTGPRYAGVSKNGSSLTLAEVMVQAANGQPTQVTATNTVTLADLDAIRLLAFQGSGGSLNTGPGVLISSTFLSLVRVG